MAKEKNKKPPKTASPQKAKPQDASEQAHSQAEKDIQQDPDLSDQDPTDDLDEGELARKDNSDEAGFDGLESPRPPQP